MFDALRSFLSLDSVVAPPGALQARTVLATPLDAVPTLQQQISAIRGQGTQPWRSSSISQALGVPAIQRAVALISNTAGSLSMQGFRNGMPLTETPRILARPDPFQTPRDAYQSMIYAMATRGETVLWIAKRDFDGSPMSLVVVPLHELTVEDNPRNRLFPKYTWGKVVGTRFSAANQAGEFVHITYFKDHPFALRGVGPLQMCGAAVSVAVEAQEWAANFFAEGGTPSTLIKSAVEIDPALNEDGYSEGDLILNQWMDKPHNVPRLIDPGIESVEEFGVNTQGAQMLEARQYNNGEAALMFGIPGTLMLYNAPGSSLTYQNTGDLFTEFVRTCLAPNYLEPLEQAFTDLLTRSTVARFYVEGLQRADIKTRYEVYGLGIDKGIIDAEEARRSEGLAPGNVEVQPILPASPAATLTSIPQIRTASETEEVRCSGKVLIRGLLKPCNRRLGQFAAPYTLTCPRCKTVATREMAPVIPFAPVVPISVARITAGATPRDLQGEALQHLIESLPDRIVAAMPKAEPPVVHIAEGAFRSDVHMPPTARLSKRIERDGTGYIVTEE